MRITLTTPSLDGGIGRNLVNLAASWCDLGIGVDLVMDHRRGALLSELPAAVTVFESGGSHPLLKAPWLARYLRRRLPAGILTPVPRHAVWALRARRLGHAPVTVIANVHNNYVMTLQAVRPKKRLSRIALLRKYYPRCDAIVPVSRGAAHAFSQLTGIPEDQLTPLPNPVITPALLAQAEDPVEHPWFNDASSPIILWVGRLEPAKNIGLLIDAFGHLRARLGLECRLAIIGTGSEETMLAGRVHASPYRESIALLGYQNNPYRFMRRAAALALCSNWEGFGNVLAEAMALGTPVVSVDCPSGPAEILENGRWGPLVPVNDATALAKGIEQCLLEPVAPADLIAAAQRYRSDIVARRYLQLLRGTTA